MARYLTKIEIAMFKRIDIALSKTCKSLGTEIPSRDTLIYRYCHDNKFKDIVDVIVRSVVKKFGLSTKADNLDEIKAKYLHINKIGFNKDYEEKTFKDVITSQWHLTHSNFAPYLVKLKFPFYTATKNAYFGGPYEAEWFNDNGLKYICFFTKNTEPVIVHMNSQTYVIDEFRNFNFDDNIVRVDYAEMKFLLENDITLDEFLGKRTNSKF